MFGVWLAVGIVEWSSLFNIFGAINVELYREIYLAQIALKKTATILNVKNTNLESLCAHPPINCLMTSLYETVADVPES